MSKTLETNSTPGYEHDWPLWMDAIFANTLSTTLLTNPPQSHPKFFGTKKKKLLMLAPSAHSWVRLGMVPLVTGASFRQQINSCVWPSNQTHTIKVTTKIILSSAGPMSHACPVWPHPHPLAHYVILCIYVFIIYYHYHFRIFGCGGSSPILVNMSMWTRNQGEQAASH